MSEATCQRCGRSFALRGELTERYPGWRPKLCPDCYARERGGGGGGTPTMVEDNLTLEAVLDRYHEGPRTGVFTDGSANPNPGPGGWGAVYVVDDEIVDQAWGHEEHTTNNRMELTAIVHGCDLVPRGTAATIHTDSRLCFDTLTSWAAGWERRGWKRKTGEIANLDLVKAAYQRLQERPELSLVWVPGHAGYRWNEYADSLSTAYLRERL